MSATTRPPSTSILKPPLSSASVSDDDVNVSPPESASILSPSLSLSSTSTLHYHHHHYHNHNHNQQQQHYSRSASSTTTTNSSSRHFSSSALGRPPGSQPSQAKRKSTPTPTPSVSFPTISSPNKTIPMKELQKIVADLKKENFDLKLRLYHLEQQTQQTEKDWLMDENQRLRLELDDRTSQMAKLEHTLSTLLQQKPNPCDASTQVSPVLLLPPPPPPTPPQTTTTTTTTTTIDTSTKSASGSHYYYYDVAQPSSHTSPFSAPVLPTFPADPASFGLPPSSALSASAVTAAPLVSKKSTFHNNNNVDVAAMVDRFQNVQLNSPKVNRRASDDHGRVTGWLDRIPIPSFMASSSTPSSPQSQ